MSACTCLGFGKDKEAKSKANSTSRKVKNLWGLVKSPSRKHKAGDDQESTRAMTSAGNSPLKDSFKSDNHEESKAPGMLKEIKNEAKDMAHKAKDFAHKVHEKTDSLLHRHHEHFQDHEQKEESTPTIALSESKEKGHGLIASAKEELQSLLHKERQHEHSQDHEQQEESTPTTTLSESKEKGHSLMATAKEELRSLLRKESTEQAKKLDGESKPEKDHKETQEDHKKLIDENTPVDEIKAPGVVERAREEVEAVVQTIHDHHQKQQTTSHVDPHDDHVHKSADVDREKGNELEDPAANKANEDGCECTLAKGLQKICAPWTTRDRD